MKNEKAEFYTSEISIVLVGNFNPIVFQPEWFANQKLLRSAETEKATVNVIHPDVVSFSTDWLSLQVTRERFTALTTSEPHRSHLLDFVVGTFNKLQHTPISQLGINCSSSIKFEQESDWHNFGHFFTPKSPWGTSVIKPGMLEVTIKSLREDEHSGALHFSVEQAGPLKAVFKRNDHYELPEGAKPLVETATFFTVLLQSEFEKSVERTMSHCTDILDRFTKTETFDDGSN